MKPLLSVSNISKRFGTLIALHDVSFDIYAGEVVGLAGDSGAGKTALAKIISGLVIPDNGRFHFNDHDLHWPFRAQAVGISTIYQEPKLTENFNIIDNIFLGQEISRPLLGNWFQIPDRGQMEKEAKLLLRKIGVHFPSLYQKVANLSSEQRQLISIAQAMAQPSSLRIMDDPSVLLSHPYQERVLELIHEWQQEKTAVLYSSSNLDHLFAVTDRIIVLRQGKIVVTVRTDESSREAIVAALVGTTDQHNRTPVIWALDNYYHARRQAETLRRNQHLLERDLEASDQTKQQLVKQLAEQVDALDRANLALQDANRRLLTNREEERKSLARELHDQIIQDLLSVNYELEDIGIKAQFTPSLVSDVVDARENIRRLVTDLRGICGDLRPPTIDSLGLGSALQSHVHTWSNRTGIEVDLTLTNDLGRLPEAIELSIFRIVQEGLNNVWKHAEATAVSVTLTQTSPRLLHITIIDNGDGLPADFDLSALSRSGHYGLLGISERVALMGGRLSFRNQAAGGMVMQVEIPHPRKVWDEWEDG